MEPLAITSSLTAAGAAGAVALATYGLVAPRTRLYGPITCRAPHPAPPAVALTFDDGPWPGSTDRILDILRDADARATFFIIGRHADRWPHLVRRIHDEGHQIGNHTFDHHRLGTLRGRAYWHDQIDRTDETIQRITGQAPRLFRPPMGLKTPIVLHAAHRRGHRTIAWSLRARDGLPTTPDKILARLLPATRPGDIILLHDGRDNASRRDTTPTAEALPALLSHMRARSLSAVRIDELLEHGLRCHE